MQYPVSPLRSFTLAAACINLFSSFLAAVPAVAQTTANFEASQTNPIRLSPGTYD
jgi:hypothetical protein